ncbi:MAG: hypothetical protein MZV70_19765, partial [Desulfobacterales bacterium]|nr:hypothetical protein [Desulfobacterales bacterium]
MMIGDGYTNVHETHTDVNGNGQMGRRRSTTTSTTTAYWNTGEPYQMYGQPQFRRSVGHRSGTWQRAVRRICNGDQALSAGRRALFDRNTLDIARGRCSGTTYWRDHRDAFNIFRIRVVSAQAGREGAVYLFVVVCLTLATDKIERST